VILILGLSWQVNQVLADDPEVVDEAPSKEDIINALRPQPGTATGGLTRSMWVESKGKEQNKPKFKSVRIDFASGSDALTDTAISKLTPMGEALSSPQLNGLRFTIEGHTDSAGRASDNDRLSLRRAEAVKDYLEAHFGINPDRIEAVGKGERELLDTHNPRSPVNRRVKIVAQK